MGLDATQAYNSILLFYPVSSIQDALIMHTLFSHYVVMTLQLCGNDLELTIFMFQGGTEEKRLLRRLFAIPFSGERMCDKASLGSLDI